LGLNKEWFLLVGSVKEGPFTLNELLVKKEFNRESFVWKPGMKEWKRAKNVPELAGYFVKEEEIEKQAEVKTPSEDSALVISYSEPPWFFLIVALIVVLIYAIFLIFN
jgi:hypothetical protein